jgi:3-oxoadipate enol-lactonase
MPASTARLWSSRRLPGEVLARRHIENALAPRTVRTRPDLVEELVARQLALSPDVDGWKAQAGAGARYAGYGRQHRIRARTLVVHGAADSVVDPRNARLLARGIPDAQLVTLSEAGHLLFWEQPQRFAGVVGDFLADGPPAGLSQLLSRVASPLSRLNQSVRAARQGARIAG